MVKASISFANTDGGFVLFGVDSRGKWVGFSDVEIRETDPAMLVEVVNGCITPEVAGLNYGVLRHTGRLFPVLHIPPSDLMPHVTTKEVAEKLPDGKVACYLQKHAVYCRYGAKSDLATAAQYARIIDQRTEMLRSEMLRRVKEVNVPALLPANRGGIGHKTIIRVSNAPNDKTASPIRITRNPLEAAGVVMHEELSEGLFEEINNVVDVNRLLAKGDRRFAFGDDIYYRIYAERQHVQFSNDTFELLPSTALERIYGPSFFWLIQLPPLVVAKLMHAVLGHPRSLHVQLVCRLAVLLGPRASRWLMDTLQKQWGSHPQPPSHFFAFTKMIESLDTKDPRLVALQQSTTSRIQLQEGVSSAAVNELLANPQRASNLLSKACMQVFQGDRDARGVCRQLDILAYGSELRKSGDAVADELAMNA